MTRTWEILSTGAIIRTKTEDTYLPQKEGTNTFASVRLCVLPFMCLTQSSLTSPESYKEIFEGVVLVGKCFHQTAHLEALKSLLQAWISAHRFRIAVILLIPHTAVVSHVLQPCESRLAVLLYPLAYLAKAITEVKRLTGKSVRLAYSRGKEANARTSSAHTARRRAWQFQQST